MSTFLTCAVAFVISDSTEAETVGLQGPAHCFPLEVLVYLPEAGHAGIEECQLLNWLDLLGSSGRRFVGRCQPDLIGASFGVTPVILGELCDVGEVVLSLCSEMFLFKWKRFINAGIFQTC